MKNIQGFSLVEVLVAVVILSTALLGLVGLQATGVKNIVNSYNRTQASQLASSLADRIRANAANAKLYSASTYITKNPAAAQEKPNCLNATGCSAKDMAENDLFYWNLALQGKSDKSDTHNSNSLVKTGTIEVCAVPYDGITCNSTATTPAVFLITITWTEGSHNSANHSVDPAINFKTVFQL